jgi:hypothetical protein
MRDKKCIQDAVFKKRPQGRSTRGRKTDIKMNFKKIRWESVGRIHVVHDTDQSLVLVNATMGLMVQ